MTENGAERRAREAEWRAELALERYRLSRDSIVLPLRLGENDVFRIDDPQQGRFVLRIHKPGYQDAVTVASELAWLVALAADGIPVNEPLPGRDGSLLQCAGEDEAAPLCVLFDWIEEETDDEREADELLMVLGEVLARIHRHGRLWQPPEGFWRQRWDLDGLVGERHVHGSYRKVPGIAPGQMALFDRTAEVVRARLARLREEPRAGWGLIHGDFSAENAIMTAAGPVVIDFDDCGFGWPVYDVAVALWRHAGTQDFPRLREALLQGYESLLTFPGEQYACLDHVIMAQRLGNLGWFGKHLDSPLAEKLPARIDEVEAACRHFLAGHR